MDEEEIESWYEEEKQKCMDEYLKDIETTKNHELAEKKYSDKLNKIIDKYNKLMAQKLENKKDSKFKKFISNIKRTIISFKEK